jgi:hypothetical protein
MNCRRGNRVIKCGSILTSLLLTGCGRALPLTWWVRISRHGYFAWLCQFCSQFSPDGFFSTYALRSLLRF